MRRKYNNMRQQMQGYIDAANAALAAGNQEEYRKQMDKANALKPELEQLQADLATMDAFGAPPAGGAGGGLPQNEAIQNLVDTLLNRQSVHINTITIHSLD